jgi:16S rRNA processing protein RimM
VNEPGVADWLAVGRVARAHGIAGELRVEALTPEVLDFAELALGRELRLRRDGRDRGRARVVGVRSHGPAYLIWLEGVEDRTAAEGLRGVELCLTRSELPELPEGWHWEADLTGMAVVDRRRGEIGRVESLDAIGAQWSLAIRRPDGAIVRAPWKEPLVLSVDRGEGRIEVDLPSGYPGLDADEDPERSNDES